MDMQAFYTGHAFDAYEFFGAHTYFGGTHFAVWAPSAQHIAVETEVGREFVERRALHDFAARAGEEALSFARVAVVDDVAHNGFEDGIAEIFQTLVVDRFTSAVAVALRFVGQRGAVKFKIVWIKSEYSV